MERRVGFACSVTFSLLFAATAQGAVITLNATTRGWFSASNNNVASPTSNYFAGLCGTDVCTSAAEFRDFFTFSIPSLDGPVVSAVLTLSTGDADLMDSPSATYQMTSIPAVFGFADLGNGTVFGSRVYSAADAGANRSINLNAAGNAAITSNNTFRIGGRITTLSANSTSEFIFGSTASGTDPSGSCPNGGPCIAQLQITTAAPAPVPEPGTWALFGLGVAGLCLARHRNTARD